MLVFWVGIVGDLPGWRAIVVRLYSLHRRNLTGEGEMDRWPIYRVRIVYTEPAFQARLATAPDFYTIDYLIRDATSPEEAENAAMREWDYCSTNSGVGWGRCIESIVVERTTGHDADGWEISCAGPAPRKVVTGWQVAEHRRRRGLR
jgi:hypothetical protein